MANREQRLIAYQIINNLNVSATLLWHIASVLQEIDPVRGGKWLVYPADTDNPVGASATTDDIKNECLRTNQILSNYAQQTDSFLGQFPVQSDIESGLSGVGVFMSDVVNDSEVFVSIKSTNLSAISLCSTKSTLVVIGTQVESAWVSLKISVVASISWLSPDDLSAIALRDLLDAMSYELRGVNSHLGQVITKDPGEIRKLIGLRIVAVNNVYGAFSFLDPLFLDVFNHIQSELPTAQTFDELETLGNYINANIPKLPLVRRWWQYV